MAEDSDRKPKVKRQDSARKNDNPQQQLLLAPGPGRTSPLLRPSMTNACRAVQGFCVPLRTRRSTALSSPTSVPPPHRTSATFDFNCQA
eukprot:3552527-Rhodomonas_salina.2